MSAAEKLTTTISTKGQVILPKALRDKKRWAVGTRLVVEETPEGLLLKPERIFPPTRHEDAFGCLKYDGPPVTLEEMDAAITEEVLARHARGRY